MHIKRAFILIGELEWKKLGSHFLETDEN